MSDNYHLALAINASQKLTDDEKRRLITYLESSLGEQRPSPEQALMSFIQAIEATGGLDSSGNPVGDPEWGDLGDAYLAACAALVRKPTQEGLEDV